MQYRHSQLRSLCSAHVLIEILFVFHCSASTTENEKRYGVLREETVDCGDKKSCAHFLKLREQRYAPSEKIKFPFFCRLRVLQR